jgi:hypothetical protein
VLALSFSGFDPIPEMIVDLCVISKPLLTTYLSPK